MLDMPYFMENEEWYYFDAKLKKYVLTDKATKKAKESYKQFYDYLENRGQKYVRDTN